MIFGNVGKAMMLELEITQHEEDARARPSELVILASILHDCYGWVERKYVGDCHQASVYNKLQDM